MNSKIKITLIIIILTFLFSDCFSQQIDSLKKGAFYSFTLKNGSIIKGKIISLNNSTIILNTKNGLNEIFRNNILNSEKAGNDFIVEYYTNFKKPEFKNYLNLSAGFVIPGKPDNSEESNYDSRYITEINNGFSLSVSYTGFFGRHMAVRTGLSYSSMKNKDAVYNMYNYTSSRTGGTLTMVSFDFDVLAGVFYPENKINYYGLAGIGIGSMNSSTVSTWDGYYTYNTDPEFQFNLRFGIGAGLTYSLSDKISLQTEINYNFNSTDDGFYNSMNQFIFKAGINFLNL